MTFTEISNLQVADCRDTLEQRLLAKMAEPTNVISEEEIAAELELYKVELTKQRIHHEVKGLVQNNCATIAAYPEAGDNYSKWIDLNILSNDNLPDAIIKLKAIQGNEITLAATQIEAADLDVRVKRIDKVFRKILVDMAHDALVAKGFSEKEIKELKDV